MKKKSTTTLELGYPNPFFVTHCTVLKETTYHLCSQRVEVTCFFKFKSYFKKYYWKHTKMLSYLPYERLSTKLI